MTSTETEPDFSQEDLSTPSGSLIDESPDPLDLSASASSMPAKRGQARAITKEKQTCAKCKAHGIKSLNKGHKNHCTLRTCKCLYCSKVDLRRLKMKQDIQRKRDLQIMARRREQGLPVDPVPITVPPENHSMTVEKKLTPETIVMIDNMQKQWNIPEPFNNRVRAIIWMVLKENNYNISKVEERYNDELSKFMHLLPPENYLHGENSNQLMIALMEQAADVEYEFRNL